MGNTQSGSKAAKVISAEEAAGLARSGMWLDYGFGMGQPDLFDKALGQRTGELRDVRIRNCLSIRPRAVLEDDPDGQSFGVLNWHFGGYDRKHHDNGRVSYNPINFGEVPDYYRRFIDHVDIACIKVCPEDENGIFNFGGACTYQEAMLERAKVVIVEVSAALPYVFGPRNGIHKSRVDFVIQGDNAPITEINNPPVTDVDRKIATLIAAEIEDGACLQIGIGGMPNAVCSMIKEAGVKDLGIHTEMMVEGMIDLYEAGLVTGARKAYDVGKMVCTFALGSRRQYQFIDRNPVIECQPVDYTNLPHNIQKHDRVVSINNTTKMDLQGQAASETAGFRHLSGTGGQLQFVRGAYASKGGKSFVCFSSTYDKQGSPQSRIVCEFRPGEVVTTPRTDTMYVVTEHGMVNLKGKSVPERAQALISIAHPSFREPLEREAREKGIMPRWFR
ncbi:MAG: acetyl-CoA hydrolase/transferase C-terminal domain-containing protein [Hyphomicrobiaceae bacterium]